MVRSMTCDVAAISICEAIGHLATSIVPHPPPHIPHNGLATNETRERCKKSRIEM